MFGTLHINDTNKEAEFVERPHGSADPERNSACDRCRAKKVKCSATYDGCRRCKRLGKSCTFTSVKQRNEKKARKAGLTQMPSDNMEDLSAKWSSKTKSDTDSKTTSPSSVDNSAQASPLPMDSALDAFDLGPHDTSLSADMLDMQSDFEMSFLPDFGQTSSDVHADNMFDAAFSPMSKFPSMLPGAQADVMPTASAWTHDNLISPSLSSGDEMTTFPGTRKQSHNSSPFASYATPTSMNASSLISNAFVTNSATGQLCQCLPAVIFAVEEFETSCNSGNRAQLDSIVTYQKRSIKCCRSMLKCTNCMVKRENLVLLVFMIEKIVAACAQVVMIYRLKDGDLWAASKLSGLPSGMADAALGGRLSLDDWDNGMSTGTSTPSRTSGSRSGSIMSSRNSVSSDWQEFHLGGYEISSPQEWEHLVRVLVFLQLRAVMDLLGDVKSIGTAALGVTQATSLAQAEIKIGELEKEVYVI